MIIKITPNDTNNPPGKLADAELHFTEGVLEGLKLIGFSVWERRAGGVEHRHLGGPERYVTFPARLRPITDTTALVRIRDLILAERKP